MIQKPIQEAIGLLTLRAGMIMEDVVLEAISAPPAEPTQLRDRLLRIKMAAEDALSLVNAADAIRRRGDV